MFVLSVIPPAVNVRVSPVCIVDMFELTVVYTFDYNMFYKTDKSFFGM
jgi:hypothetical protein